MPRQDPHAQLAEGGSATSAGSLSLDGDGEGAAMDRVVVALVDGPWCRCARLGLGAEDFADCGLHILRRNKLDAIVHHLGLHNTGADFGDKVFNR